LWVADYSEDGHVRVVSAKNCEYIFVPALLRLEDRFVVNEVHGPEKIIEPVESCISFTLLSQRFTLFHVTHKPTAALPFCLPLAHDFARWQPVFGSSDCLE
jgi:hypothetical protein